MSYTPRTDAAERAGSYRDMRAMEIDLAACRAALAEMLLFADGFCGKSAFDLKKKKARAILAETAQKGAA